MSEATVVDWDPIRDLAGRDERGEPLVLSDEVLGTLQRTAREVSISDTDLEEALKTEAGARELLRECMRRINAGSRLLTPALRKMYDLREAGDIEGARKVMRDVLAVEVVPFYRDIAEGQLEFLDDLERARSAAKD